jgi:hypothetical protein
MSAPSLLFVVVVVVADDVRAAFPACVCVCVVTVVRERHGKLKRHASGQSQQQHMAAAAAVQLSDGIYQFACPHCHVTVQVAADALNCGVFRCGLVKASGQQVPPHAPLAECDRLRADRLIWGCAKPFRFDGTTVAKCDYV